MPTLFCAYCGELHWNERNVDPNRSFCTPEHQRKWDEFCYQYRFWWRLRKLY